MLYPPAGLPVARLPGWLLQCRHRRDTPQCRPVTTLLRGCQRRAFQLVQPRDCVLAQLQIQQCWQMAPLTEALPLQLMTGHAVCLSGRWMQCRFAQQHLVLLRCPLVLDCWALACVLQMPAAASVGWAQVLSCPFQATPSAKLP